MFVTTVVFIRKLGLLVYLFACWVFACFLLKRPMHGQEIADEIARGKGKKPSPGTISSIKKS